MIDVEIEMPDRIFATCENHECEWSDERYRHWNHQVEYVRADLLPPVTPEARMRVTEAMVNAADSVLSRKRPGIPDETIRLAILAALAAEQRP